MFTCNVCGATAPEMIVSRRDPHDDSDPQTWRPIVVCQQRADCLRRAERRALRILTRTTGEPT